MKKFLLLTLLWLTGLSAYASSLNHLVFFGDSLSDNGNLYRLLKIIPKSPPYYQGRFSNGPTWAEEVGQYFYQKDYIDTKIYAVGGATAAFHFPTPKFVAPTNLELEVDLYLVESLFTDRSQTLFAIWIGGNDYLFDETDTADEVTGKVVDKITWAVNTLIAYGAKNFLILNLPDLSFTPLAHQEGLVEKLHNLSQLNNQKLDAAVAQIKQANPAIKMVYVDTNSVFNDFMIDPKKYNQKYGLNIQNTTDACWEGGMLFKNNRLNSLRSDIRQELAGTTLKTYDGQAVSDFIMLSPAMKDSYLTGELYASGASPCANADQYFFWDHLHPTASIHRLISQVVVEDLTAVLG